MSLNRHSTPPGGVNNPIDSPPPRAYAPPIAPHWAGGCGIPWFLGAQRHSSRIGRFFYARIPFMAAGVGASQDAPVPRTRYANPMSAATQTLGIVGGGSSVCSRSSL